MLFHVKKPKRLVRAIKKKARKTYIPRYPFTIVGSRSRPSAAAEDGRGRKRSPKTVDGATVCINGAKVENISAVGAGLSVVIYPGEVDDGAAVALDTTAAVAELVPEKKKRSKKAAVEKIKKEQPSKREKKKKPEPKVAPEPFLASFILFSLPVVRQLVFLLRLFGWVLLDIARKIISRRTHIYGIWCFVGLPGFGKTMSLVHYLDNMRRRYGDRIIIATNFYYAGQDFAIDSWELILEDYDKPVIFGYDELQNEFFTRNYKKFPPRLISELTQNRKGNGKQIVYTTQVFGNVDKVFRDLTTEVVDCKTYFGRFTSCRYYKRELYDCRNASKSVDRKWKIKPKRKVRFIQTDYLRSRYDSFKRLDYLKGLEHKGIGEGEGEEA